ncbi:MAG: hypothetical protein LBU16_09995, partial [Treponema sp.]|nr:hypothetical protein [Treponema sp.]
MSVPKFNLDEMKVAREMPSFVPGTPGTKVYSTPVSLEEGFVAAMRREPIWYVSGFGMETSMFNPRICRDYIARAFCFDGEGMVMNDQMGVAVGGPDMFGIEWVFV